MVNLTKLKGISKLIIFTFVLMVFTNGAWAQTISTETTIQSVDSFQGSVDKFTNLTSDRIAKIKVGSRPFILSQNKKAPTVVMIHGLSDSPGSMVETSKVYFKLSS